MTAPAPASTPGAERPSPSPHHYLPFVLSVRILNAAFFLVTALYGILCSVPFAYHQFIEPRLWKWPSLLTENHHYLYWACLLLTFATARRRGFWLLLGLQVAYAVVSLAAGRLLLAWPVLVMVEGTPRGLLVGGAALLFPLGLAAIDLVALKPRLAPQSFDGRLLPLSMVAATAVAATYAALAVTHLSTESAGELAWYFVALGVGISAVTHLGLFLVPIAGIVLVTAGTLRRARHPWWQYTLLLFGLAAALTMLMEVHVLTVAGVWFGTWVAVCRSDWRRGNADSVWPVGALRSKTRTWAVVAACVGAGLLAEREVLTSDRLPTVRLALDDYAEADQSFRIVTRFLTWRTTNETAEFNRFLQANTNIAHADVAPMM